MKNVASIAASIAGFGPLAFLSIQHTPPGTEPDVFTNEERVRAYRDAQPTRRASARHWSFQDEGVPVLEG
ncbi:hypothetical protein MNQ95_08620 [Pseudoxanthomonas daejeonensis]|uniref:hypothetical protein n=1 Tax=Pseudoxanthomonas daejeonensis TaxID=266062 RepID=UPI001F545046|nr:hypothetical protein [Pseudoxanthomonas daejeonensis]UNK56241.1 hypothetical protein MNQ95_08620 [Pseudoxanthomonas daejeonensis]